LQHVAERDQALSATLFDAERFEEAAAELGFQLVDG